VGFRLVVGRSARSGYGVGSGRAEVSQEALVAALSTDDDKKKK
jgi:hypothetical protein